LIPNNSLIFDVGANIGNKTHFYIQHNHKVICFEPLPDLAEGIRTRFKNIDKVIVENIGLSNSEDIKTIYKCSAAPTLSSCSEEYIKVNRFVDHGYIWDTQIQIQTKTLDQMIQKYGIPYYCKIDVEGYEYDVLQGLTQKIPVISFECNIDQFENTKKCLDYLSKLGYDKFNYTFAERGYFLFNGWLSTTELINKIEDLIKTVDFSSIWGLWGDIYSKIDI